MRATLTDRGRARLEQLYPLHVELLDRLLRQLTVEDRRSAEGLLERLGADLGAPRR